MKHRGKKKFSRKAGKRKGGKGKSRGKGSRIRTYTMSRGGIKL